MQNFRMLLFQILLTALALAFTFAVRYALNSETNEAGSFGGTTQHRGITVSEMFSGIAKEDR